MTYNMYRSFGISQHSHYIHASKRGPLFIYSVDTSISFYIDINQKLLDISFSSLIDARLKLMKL